MTNKSAAFLHIKPPPINRLFEAVISPLAVLLTTVAVQISDNTVKLVLASNTVPRIIPWPFIFCSSIGLAMQDRKIIYANTARLKLIPMRRAPPFGDPS